MDNNLYDVIVIGAGNAGLSAAATTARHGLKTLVIERNLLPGGCATSFRRGRFEFETSLHELANVGPEDNPGTVRKFFEEYGIDIDWCIEKTAFRAIVDGEDGYDVTMPVGVDAFCDEMERQVPGSYDSVRAVFDLAKKADAALAYLSQGKPDPQVLMTEHVDFLRMASHSVNEGLDALGMPKKAQHILSTYWSYLGSPTDQLDFLLYTIMDERYIGLGPAMPHMRSNELALALESSIRRNGGEIWYNTEVSQILVRDGKAYGVRIGNKEIYAKKIISNCHPGTAYKKLLSKDHIPEKAVKLANARTNGMQFFTMYIGLCRSAKELGINDYSVFLLGSPDTREQYNSCENINDSLMIVNCLNNVLPDASPEGTSTLFFTTLLIKDLLEGVSPEEYKKVKNNIADTLIRRYEEKLGVSIRPYIEEIAISTPATFARYLNTPGGTPYGYELTLWDSMMARTLNGKNEQLIGNLWLVGAHGERGDGYNSTYANGRCCGLKAVREIHLEKECE